MFSIISRCCSSPAWSMSWKSAPPRYEEKCSQSRFTATQSS